MIAPEPTRPLPSGSRIMTARDRTDSASPVASGRPATLALAARSALLAVVGSLLLTLSAKLQVPFYPVPMTLQPGVVLLIGVAYGPRLGFGTLLLYLAEGAMGLPVFAGTPERGIGLAYMMGPTGGYLAVYPFVAALCGLAAERARGWLGTAAGVALAMALIYAGGVAWLSTFVGFQKAVAAGVLPFLLGDLVKLALVVALTEAGLGTLRRRLLG